MPTPLLEESTPFQKLYDKDPDYFDLKPFGCLCYVSSLERDETKFDNRAHKAIFLGYVLGMKGYKVYIPVQHKFAVSRHIKFIENVFPYDIDVSNDEIENPSSSNDNTEKSDVLVENSKNKRIRRQPGYLKDYHCNLIPGKRVNELEKDKLYPLSSVVSYEKLS